MDSLWRAMFRMVEFLKQKRVIIPIVFLLVVVVSGLVSFVVITNVTDKNSKNQTKVRNEEKKPAPTPKQVKAPVPSSPEKCKEYAASITQVLGGQDRQIGTSIAKTDDQSSLTQCGYYKGKMVTTVKVYEYPTDTEAVAALSKWKVGGYETQNKGKYVVSVSVALETGPDTNSSGKVLASILEKLQ